MGYPAYVLNLLDGDATVTPSDAATAYPVANLCDLDAAKPFRFATGAGGTLTIDFGLVRTIDTVGFINHNFAETAEVSIEDGSTSPATLIGAAVYREHDLYYRLSTPVTSRYLVIVIDDNNGIDNDALTQIGELVIGLAAAFSPSYRFGETEELVETKIRHVAQSGRRRVYDLASQWTLSYRFFPLTRAQLAQFVALHSWTRGDGVPFLWIPDLAEAACYFVTKEPGLKFEGAADEQVFSYDLSLIEEARGVSITA